MTAWDAVSEVAPFAFRVLDEIDAYVTGAERLGVSWQEALDEQLLQKVLPKVKGTDQRIGACLDALVAFTADSYPLTNHKAEEMLDAFNQYGFTSYF